MTSTYGFKLKSMYQIFFKRMNNKTQNTKIYECKLFEVIQNKTTTKKVLNKW